jgi:putative tryptophan/tyrosine transport system substrate-binding protein
MAIAKRSSRVSELRLPAIYQWPETAQEGGLLAYGPRFSDVFRQLARQTVKVLRGVKPAELPVRTAKAMVLDFLPTLLARADEVIE